MLGKPIRSEKHGNRRWFSSLRNWLTFLRNPIGELDALVSALAVLGIVAGIFLLGLITAQFVNALTDPSRSFEAARNLGLILAAAIGLPFLVWRSWVGERQARAALWQARSAEENLVTNSFTRAIDQLGATREIKERDDTAEQQVTILRPNIEVRLGALYALERLVRYSERDSGAIIEILQAYARENARSYRLERQDWVFVPAASGSLGWNYGNAWRRYGNDLRRSPSTREDLQACISILLGINKDKIDSTISQIDWTKIDATHSDLRSLIAPYSNMRFANLMGADLSDSDLRGIDLSRARLNGAVFNRVDLTSANLRFSDLRGARFYNSRLIDADFQQTDMSGIDMNSCEANGAKFTFAKAQGANVEYVDLTGADLEGSNFCGSKFHGLHLLEKTNWRRVNMNAVQISFSSADPTSSFAEASALGADLSSFRGLTREHIESMFIGDGETILPPELQDYRPSNWPDQPLSQHDFEKLIEERDQIDEDFF